MEIYSRYDDPTPVRCSRCGWEGLVSECVHTYRGYSVRLSDETQDADVEPVDECPRCGSDWLEDIDQEPVVA